MVRGMRGQLTDLQLFPFQSAIMNGCPQRIRILLNVGYFVPRAFYRRKRKLWAHNE